MKTVIKLILINFGLQILVSYLLGLVGMLLCYLYTDSVQQGLILSGTMAPTVLLSNLLMAVYLFKAGYLSGDRQLYSLLRPLRLMWALLWGISAIVLTDCIASFLPLPDLTRTNFAVMSHSAAGLLAVVVIGPVVEELLFRGVITKKLLQCYSPWVAILLSALIFGAVHINPAQVLPAFFMGLAFAWLFHQTGSVIPGIVVHVLNNGVYCLQLLYRPDAQTTAECLGSETLCLALYASAFVLFVLSLWRFRAENKRN